MKKYMKTLMVGLVVGAAGMTTSCDLEYTPRDWFTAQSFWGSQTEFEGNIYALSRQFRNNGYPTTILFDAGEIRAGVFELSTVDGSGIASAQVIQNVFNKDNTQFSNFGGYYGFIANLNELIYRCDEKSDVLSEDVKNGLLGIAHGWRAYCYFQMYRMYGGVVIRETPDVQMGNYNATELYKARATAQETLDFIKADIKKSLDYFASSTYQIDKSNPEYYWSKAATEMLAGEVYLWSGKVETGDHQANPADVATAATYFNNVINNYGFSLEPYYFDVWTKQGNPEAIYSIIYSSETEGVYFNYPTRNLLWARVTGNGYNSYWSTHDNNDFGHLSDGRANRFGRWHDPATGETGDWKIWAECNYGVMRYTYKNAIYYQMDDADTRKEMFYPVWHLKDAEREGGVMYLDNFDPKEYNLFGTYIQKFRPKRMASSDYFQCAIDVPMYRLALAHMYAAECANYAGDNANVEHHINLVRARAYGENWDPAKYGYVAGSFAENENAIMREKDKEFLMEGQRWWDLRRLTTVKDGSQKDHFVFQPQGCYGYGLDPVANPWMVDINEQPIETDVPVLNGTTQGEHLLLWPINKGLMDSDPKIEQNPGY